MTLERDDAKAAAWLKSLVDDSQNDAERAELTNTVALSVVWRQAVLDRGTALASYNEAKGGKPVDLWQALHGRPPANITSGLGMEIADLSRLRSDPHGLPFMPKGLSTAKRALERFAHWVTAIEAAGARSMVGEDTPEDRETFQSFANVAAYAPDTAESMVDEKARHTATKAAKIEYLTIKPSTFTLV